MVGAKRSVDAHGGTQMTQRILMRFPEVKKLHGTSRSSIYKFIAEAIAALALPSESGEAA
jgi:predicted DNA-binding transcriptional regulator AlpA